MSSATRRDFYFLLAVCVASMGALLWHVVRLDIELVDDAAISIAYGKSLFEGAGFRLTPSSQVVEGFSNPLWTVLLGLGTLFGGTGIGFAKWSGVFFGVAALPAYMLWPAVAAGRTPRIEDAFGGLFAAFVPSYVLWIASGMETGLFSFLLAVTGLVFLKELRSGSGGLTGLALALVCLTRPEGPIFVVAAAIVWLSARVAVGRLPGGQEARIVLWFSTAFGSYLVFRWVYFAALLPNTYFAKQTWDFSAADYIRGYFRAHLTLSSLAAVGLVIGVLGSRRLRWCAALVGTFCGAILFFSWFSRGDWMREWRFLAPMAPLLGLGFSIGFSVLRERLSGGLSRRSLAGASGLILVGIAGLAIHVAGQMDRMRGMRGELPYSFIVQGIKRDLLPRMPAGAERTPRIGFPDIGGMGLLMRHAEVIDLAQLADYALARHAKNRKAQEDYLLHDARPSVLDIHGPSGHYREMPLLMSFYTHAGGQFWLLTGLSSETDPRCEVAPSALRSMKVEAVEHLVEGHVERGAYADALRSFRCAQTHRARDQLPGEDWRKSLAERLNAIADDAVDSGRTEDALRAISLATYLDDDAPHRRRKAEQLRTMLYSDSAEVSGSRP